MRGPFAWTSQVVIRTWPVPAVVVRGSERASHPCCLLTLCWQVRGPGPPQVTPDDAVSDSQEQDHQRR
jgi:hypothetical protein